MQRVAFDWCHTFSIVARDPSSGALGVAVQSRALAVGSLVPWVRAGVGAIATQAYTEPRYGTEGLTLLAEGIDPQAIFCRIASQDTQPELRQVAILAADGRIAVHTGEGCPDHASHLIGKDFACQGNLLESRAVIEDMAAAFETAHGTLEHRLLQALYAAQRAGGDRRGKQSSALHVARSSIDSYKRAFRIDLRVDDHPSPITELERLLDLFLVAEASDPPPPSEDS